MSSPIDWAEFRSSNRWGLVLAAQGGVWVLDDTWTDPLVWAFGYNDYNTWGLSGYLFTGVWNRGSLWIAEADDALLVAQVQEERSALSRPFDTRPWAMPLQEREQMSVLLAQRGLTCHVLRGIVFAYAGLPVFQGDLSLGATVLEGDFPGDFDYTE